jgi:hypothetical protein
MGTTALTAMKKLLVIALLPLFLSANIMTQIGGEGKSRLAAGDFAEKSQDD